VVAGGKVYRLANIPEPLLRYRFSVTGMTLGRKWQQALYTKMAVISSRHPERSLDQVRQEAAAELESRGKGWFLEQVARGTIQELICLGCLAMPCALSGGSRGKWTAIV